MYAIAFDIVVSDLKEVYGSSEMEDFELSLSIIV